MKNKTITHWIVLALMCGLAGSSIGICSNTVGIFYTPVSESLGVLRGTFALQSTLSLMVTGVTCLFLPALMKKLPYKLILIAGALSAALSTAGMAFSRSIPLFYILGIIRGAGAATFYSLPVTMTINNWFEEKHGLATSIALSFSGLAGALFSPVLGWCVDAFGWSKAYLVQAGLILLLTLPAMIFPYSLDPADMGLLPYGHVGEPALKAEFKPEKKSFNFLSVGFICFAVFAVMHTSISGIGQHLTGFAESVGFTASVGATMVSFAMIGNIGTKLVIGWLSDRFGPVKASIIMIILNAGSLMMIFSGGAAHNQALLSVSAFLYGSVYSVGAVGIALLTKHFFGMENYASVYPKVSLVTSIGSSAALTLVGYVFDFTGSYDYALWGAAVMDAVNILLLLIVVRKAKALRS